MFSVEDLKNKSIRILMVHSLHGCNGCTQWLNYSKGGGGTLHFVPSLPFQSFLNTLPPFPPPIPLEVGQPPFKGSGKAL